MEPPTLYANGKPLQCFWRWELARCRKTQLWRLYQTTLWRQTDHTHRRLFVGRYIWPPRFTPGRLAGTVDTQKSWNYGGAACQNWGNSEPNSKHTFWCNGKFPNFLNHAGIQRNHLEIIWSRNNFVQLLPKSGLSMVLTCDGHTTLCKFTLLQHNDLYTYRKQYFEEFLMNVKTFG